MQNFDYVIVGVAFALLVGLAIVISARIGRLEERFDEERAERRRMANDWQRESWLVRAGLQTLGLERTAPQEGKWVKKAVEP